MADRRLLRRRAARARGRPGPARAAPVRERGRSRRGGGRAPEAGAGGAGRGVPRGEGRGGPAAAGRSSAPRAGGCVTTMTCPADDASDPRRAGSEGGADQRATQEQPECARPEGTRAPSTASAAGRCGAAGSRSRPASSGAARSIATGSSRRSPTRSPHFEAVALVRRDRGLARASRSRPSRHGSVDRLEAGAATALLVVLGRRLARQGERVGQLARLLRVVAAGQVVQVLDRLLVRPRPWRPRWSGRRRRRGSPSRFGKSFVSFDSASAAFALESNWPE